MSLSSSDRPVIRLPVVMMNGQGEFISGEALGSNPHPKGREGLPAATPQAPTAVPLCLGSHTAPTVEKSWPFPSPPGSQQLCSSVGLDVAYGARSIARWTWSKEWNLGLMCSHCSPDGPSAHPPTALGSSGPRSTLVGPGPRGDSSRSPRAVGQSHRALPAFTTSSSPQHLGAALLLGLMLP